MKSVDIQHGKETWEQLEEIHRFGYSYATIFNDFIETCLLALLSLTDNMKHADLIERLQQNKLTGMYEDQYLQLVAKYKENKSQAQGKRPIDSITKAWGSLQKETQEYNQDVLGEIFMTQISRGEHGQFFTPVHVTDMMAQMTGATQGETVSDPCVGSGRFFISMAKRKKDLHFTGVDISPTCAKMAALNMWLFDLNADIYHGDSLSMEMSHVWKIRKGGFLYESKVEAMPEPVKIQIQTQAQQRLFDVNEIEKKVA